MPSITAASLFTLGLLEDDPVQLHGGEPAGAGRHALEYESAVWILAARGISDFARAYPRHGVLAASWTRVEVHVRPEEVAIGFLG